MKGDIMNISSLLRTNAPMKRRVVLTRISCLIVFIATGIDFGQVDRCVPVRPVSDQLGEVGIVDSDTTYGTIGVIFVVIIPDGCIV